MKEFNIELAKQGKPVCTRDGRKARIICFDAKNPLYSIVALVEDSGKNEVIYSYTSSGQYAAYDRINNDLVMTPEKHEGWVNIYKNNLGFFIGNTIHSTKKDAKTNSTILNEYVTTTHIEFED